MRAIVSGGSIACLSSSCTMRRMSASVSGGVSSAIILSRRSITSPWGVGVVMGASMVCAGVVSAPGGHNGGYELPISLSLLAFEDKKEDRQRRDLLDHRV